MPASDSSMTDRYFVAEPVDRPGALRIVPATAVDFLDLDRSGGDPTIVLCKVAGPNAGGAVAVFRLGQVRDPKPVSWEDAMSALIAASQSSPER